ncbi:MAG: M1 family peptidase [Cytophagales bacterium]|nr:MAG: M1 family peptidase [Cytophagales bacterium]TAF60470.1 MAG: M1 family peptidase [Cytophagales bacterium]
MRRIVKISFTVCFLFLYSCLSGVLAQTFTAADTLMGSNTPERACFDVLHYHLQMRFWVESKSVNAHNDIRFRVQTATQQIQLELVKNLKIDSVFLIKGFEKQKLSIMRQGRSFYVNFPQILPQNSVQTVRVHYSGSPQIAKNPPWDGGFTWAKDKNNKPWAAVSCQGIGASVWLPCKDYLGDEPDSVLLSYEAPNGLFVASNGNLVQKETLADAHTRYTWAVSYPINPYGMSFVMGNLAHISDTLELASGDMLPLDYYVLQQNKQKAEKHFQQSKKMLLIFEELFGPYPFPRDGFALLETPFWGMEHQSGIAYGNDYKNTPYGFDFIILHESGHEYFGNSLSVSDNAELWIHESFTTYAETMFLEKLSNPTTALNYLNGQKTLIANKKPIVPPHFGVNYNYHDNDIYYKGAWMLHSIRTSLNNEPLWFELIKSFVTEFAYSHLSTQQVIDFFCQKTQKDLKPIFEQYLYQAEIPELVVKISTKGKQAKLSYNWNAKVQSFNMPVRVYVGIPERELWLNATNEVQEIQLTSLEAKHFRADLQNFLMLVKVSQ